MKYIRIQKVVKRVCDDNIKDMDVIKKILSSIKEKQFYCSIILEKDFHVVDYSKVRIILIEDLFFKYRVFGDRGTMVDSSSYEHIKELKVETEIEKEMDPNELENKWASLDLGD